MKTIGLLFAFALSLSVSIVRAEPIVPDEIPEDVGIVVETRNLEALGTATQRLVSAVEPTAMIPPPAMMLPSLVLKTTNPQTVDLTKPLQVILFLPPAAPKPAMIFSVTDGAAYLASIPLQKQDGDGDVQVFTAGQKVFAVAVVGNRAVASDDSDVTKKAAAMLEDGKFKGQVLPGEHHLSLAFRPKASLEGLAEAQMNPFGLARQQMQGAMAMAADPDQKKMMQLVLVELDAVEKLLGQVEGLTVGLDLAETGLTVNKLVQPLEGSGLATYLGSVPEGEMEMLKYVPANSMAFYTARFGDLEPVMAWAKEMFTQWAGDDDATPFVQTMDKWVAAVGNQVAQAFVANDMGTLTSVGAVALKDEAAMQDILANMEEMVKAFLPMQNMANGPKVDVKVAMGAAEHAGVKLHEITTTFEMPAETNIPPQVMMMQQTMMELLLGKDGKSYVGVKDKAYVYAQGDGSLDAVKASLDGTGSIAGSPNLDLTLKTAPKGASLLGFISVTDAINFGLDAAQRIAPQMTMMLNDRRLQPADPITFGSGVTGEGNVTATMHVPVGVAKSVYSFWREMMQAMMPPQGGMAPQPMLP